MIDTTHEDALPLAGIRVIDVATVIAAPYCAGILGEFGAEVLKVEHPIGGDICRKYGTPTQRGDTLAWLSEARNKKSVTIDLHRPEGVEIFNPRGSRSSSNWSKRRTCCVRTSDPAPWKNGACHGRYCTKSIRV